MEKVLSDGQVIKLRKVQVKDASLLLDFLTEVNRETRNLSREPHEVTMSLEDEIAFIKRVLDSENDSFFVAFDDESVIGTIGYHGSSLERLRHKVSLGISVLKRYHGKGIGSVLMEALIEEAKANKKHKIELEVRLDNKEAISLYEKFGFVVEGTRKDGFYAEERYIDLLLMGKILED